MKPATRVQVGRPPDPRIATDNLEVTFKLILYFWGQPIAPNLYSLPSNSVTKSLLDDMGLEFIVNSRTRAPNLQFFYFGVARKSICGLHFTNVIVFPSEIVLFPSVDIRNIAKVVYSIGLGYHQVHGHTCLLPLRFGAGHELKQEMGIVGLFLRSAGLSFSLEIVDDLPYFDVVFA